jgi:hypothetical protein
MRALCMGRLPALLVVAVALSVRALGAQELALPVGPAGITVGVDGSNARVLTARAGTVLPARDVSLAGFRAAYRRAGSRLTTSLHVRQSTLANDLAFGDLSAAFALSAFSLEAGYGWRRGYELSTGLAHGDLHHLARVGGRWRVPLVATPFTIEGRFAMFVPVEYTPAGGEALAGWEGETGVRMALVRLPIDALLGYRFERFRVHRTEQEVSLLHLGLVWHRGGSR